MQSKGRVERAFGTLQDRLVKELRLAGISTIEAANAWVPAFMVDYNTRFGRDPENAKDLHRKLTAADDLSEVLAWREERTVTKNLTLHYDRMMLMLDRDCTIGMNQSQFQNATSSMQYKRTPILAKRREVRRLRMAGETADRLAGFRDLYPSRNPWPCRSVKENLVFVPANPATKWFSWFVSATAMPPANVRFFH